MCGESGFVDVTLKEAHLLLFWECLDPECRVKEENRKEEGKCRNRKRRKIFV